MESVIKHPLKLAQYSVRNCLWAQHVAERPDRAWKVFGAVLQLWQKRNDAPDINDTFDRLSFLESGMLPYQSSPERFRVMNPMLIYCLEQRATMMEPEMFLRFVETCRAEDISQHLPIFSSFLPINNAKGAGQLSAWIGSQATDRFIAMYILHCTHLNILHLMKQQVVFLKKSHIYLLKKCSKF